MDFQTPDNDISEIDQSELSIPEKEMPLRKQRGLDSLNVLVQQNLAAKEFKDKKVRKFKQVMVEIETLGSHPIRVPIWQSDEKPSFKRKKPIENEMFACQTCGKEFDENRKVLIHARSHKKEKNEGDEIIL